MSEASMFHFWPFWFFWPFHGLMTLLLIVVLVIVLFRHRPVHYPYPAGPYPAAPPAPAATPSRSEALAILEARYARGEIQRDEYLQKKADLGG